MPLPTKVDFLAQLQPLDSNDPCPICRLELTVPFTTACKHTFCRECLLKWTRDHPSCPTCRKALYETGSHESDNSSDDEEDDEEAEEDFEDGFIIGDGDDEEDEGDDNSESSDDYDYRIDEATARKMAIDTGWVELSFEVNRDSVIDKLTKRIVRGTHLDEPGDEDDLVTIISHTLIETAIASLLYIKPRRDKHHCLHSTNHYIWEAIMEAAREVFISQGGETLEASLLWELLVDASHEAAGASEGGGFPRYSPVHENAHGDQFESDMYWFVDAIVEQARLDYVSSV